MARPNKDQRFLFDEGMVLALVWALNPSALRVLTVFVLERAAEYEDLFTAPMSVRHKPLSRGPVHESAPHPLKLVERFHLEPAVARPPWNGLGLKSRRFLLRWVEWAGLHIQSATGCRPQGLSV